MSDYLSHIAAKSFNQTEVLQPRLASRFEPLAAVSNLQAEAALDWKQPLVTEPLLEPEPNDRLPINPFLHDRTSMVHADLTSEMASEQRDVPLPQLDEMVRLPKSNDDEMVASKPETLLKKPITGTFPSIEDSLDAPLRTQTQAKRQKSERLQGFHQRDGFRGEQLVTQEPSLHQNQPPQQTLETPIQPNFLVGSAIEGKPADVMEPSPTSASMRSKVLDVDLALLKVERSPIIQRVVQQLVVDSHYSADQTSLLPTSDVPRLAPSNTELVVPLRWDDQRSPSDRVRSSLQPVQPSHQIPTPVSKRVQSLVQPAIAVQPEPQPNATIAPTEPTPAPLPTIHVTIGRIEVRATPPPSSPSKPAPKPAVMGLSDYLRQRAQGAS